MIFLLSPQDTNSASEAMERYQDYLDPTWKGRPALRIEYAQTMMEVWILPIFTSM